jgi:hypothetical protein
MSTNHTTRTALSAGALGALLTGLLLGAQGIASADAAPDPVVDNVSNVRGDAETALDSSAPLTLQGEQFPLGDTIHLVVRDYRSGNIEWQGDATPYDLSYPGASGVVSVVQWHTTLSTVTSDPINAGACANDATTHQVVVSCLSVNVQRPSLTASDPGSRSPQPTPPPTPGQQLAGSLPQQKPPPLPRH